MTKQKDNMYVDYIQILLASISLSDNPKAEKLTENNMMRFQLYLNPKKNHMVTKHDLDYSQWADNFRTMDTVYIIEILRHVNNT